MESITDTFEANFNSQEIIKKYKNWYFNYNKDVEKCKYYGPIKIKLLVYEIFRVKNLNNRR